MVMGRNIFFLLSAVVSAAAQDWRYYGADAGSMKYTALSQIDASNFARLRIAWKWRSIDMPIQEQRKIRAWLFEPTPLAVNGILFTSTSLSQVAAIDGATGRTLWTYDPKSYEGQHPPVYGYVHRGVAYWRDGEDERIFIGTVDNYLIAVNARTGSPVAQFGNRGRVDLMEGLPKGSVRHRMAVTSPPIICRGVVMTGSALGDGQAGPSEGLPPGDIQGFDVRTGKRLWTFHSVPHRGEFGSDTWAGNSAAQPRGVSAWTPLSADEKLGYVYLPFSTPANDYFGGARPGANLFGSSIVCLNARTGKRVWHFQTSHHDVWDYDPPAAPVLADLRVAGKKIAALIQVTKQGFCFVLDRATGNPVWPVEERPVPPSDVAVERLSPTQPFPTKPLPFDRQGTSLSDLIDFTPELRAEAEAIVRQYRQGPLYAAPSFLGTISTPGSQGGASWAGAGFDPESQILYVPSVTRPTVITVREPSDARNAFSTPTLDPLRGSRVLLTGPEGLPLFKPPFGRITAIDLTTGDHRWQVASGEGPRSHPRLRGMRLPPLGWPLRTFVLVTRTLLITSQEGPVGPERFVGHVEAEHGTRDAKLRAYDKRSGRLLDEIAMPANATGSPMSYFAGGRQFIVVATGGSNLPAELISFALP